MVSIFDNVTSFLPDSDDIIDTDGFSKFVRFDLKELKLIRCHSRTKVVSRKKKSLFHTIKVGKKNIFLYYTCFHRNSTV